MNSQLLADLERDEGYRANAYLDTEQIWSLGIGRNLEANPLTGAEWKQLLDAGELAVSISLAGARRLVRNALPAIAVQCAGTFTWWATLDEARRDVIANLAYNMGLRKLIGFAEMLRAMHARDYDRAADELQDSRWFRQVKSRGPRLVNQLRTGIRA
jgi:lysozyme